MVRFGPSGNDVLFYQQGGKSSVQSPAWVAGLGLSAFEVNFGRGIKMGEKMAAEIAAEAQKHNVEISAHAPYYINLGTNDPEGVKKSYGYIEKCLRLLKIMGGKRLVIHIGSQGDLNRETAIENVKKNLKWVLSELSKHGLDDFLFCIETMGRYKAIGTYQEICDICKIDSRLIPTLDFGHINSILQGELQHNPEKIVEIMEYVEREIGHEKIKKIHIHFSAVVFTEKGEHKHTTLDDERWSFPFEPLAHFIKDKKLEPVIICESEDIMAQDAVVLKNVWHKILKNP